MTEIEKKALALVNEVRAEHGGHPNGIIAKNTYAWDALCRALEHHEAYKQEVSDAIHKHWGDMPCEFDRFIIPKPVDPLVEALAEAGYGSSEEAVYDLRTALAARGGRIVFDQPEGGAA